MTERPTGFNRDGTPITVEWLARRIKDCILCGAAATMVGVYQPTTESAYALLVKASSPTKGPVPEGKLRTAVYGLCTMCLEDPNAPQRVEDHFLRECNKS